MLGAGAGGVVGLALDRMGDTGWRIQVLGLRDLVESSDLVIISNFGVP